MRLIDADDILPMMERKMDMQDLYLPIHFQEMVIDEMPTVDAEPVRHGHWDKHYHEEEDFAEWWAKCSKCGYTEAVFARGHICNNWNYCPRCGAKMDATQSNDSNALDALKGERREDDAD